MKKIYCIMACTLFLFSFASANAITISAMIDPNNEITESNESNNTETVNVGVVQTTPLKFAFVPIDYHNSSDFLTDVNINKNFLIGTYPITRESSEFYTLPNLDSGTVDGDLPYIGPSLVVWSLSIGQFLSGNTYDKIVGVVPTGWFAERGFPGTLGMSNFIASLIEPETIYHQIAAHEIGHTFGFCEEYSWIRYNFQDLMIRGGCKNKFPLYCLSENKRESCRGSNNINGFWVEWLEETEREMQTTEDVNYYCFMGDSSRYYRRWIERDDYIYLLDTLKAPKATVLSDSPSEVILVSGLIDLEGNMEFFPFYLTVGTPTEPSEGGYQIELQNSEGDVLGSFNFNFVLFYDSSQPDLNVAPFVFAVPYDPNTHKITGKYNGETKAERIVSNNAPIVSVVSPAGGEEWSGVHSIIWQGIDADGDALSYVLQYSSDGGSTWNPLAISVTETSYDLNFSLLEDGNNYKVKVIATDGVLTGVAISNTFSSVNLQGIVLISPDDGAIIDNTQVFSWTGTGFKSFTLQIGMTSEFNKRQYFNIRTRTQSIEMKKYFRKLLRLEEKDEDKVLYWRVLGKRSNKQVEFSNTRAFTIKST